jgi:sulfopyruvate decarboxylase TPP-binding subunit
LKKLTQKQIFDFLSNNGIENFIGVPDSTLKYFIEQGLKKKKILIATREEEAIGIATGMLLSKSPSVIFLQNAGFANSLSTITSLVQLYQFPLIFLIGWRGYQKSDAPEHKKIGEIQPELIKSLGLKSRIISDKKWKKCCNWVITEIKSNHTCALIVPREFVD